MAQHDYVIANQSGAAFRADLNNGLAAIVTLNSGATAPSTTYAYMLWADTTAGLLKMRNAANNAWITLRELDGTLAFEDGTAAAPGLAFASDLNTGIYRIGADSLGISTGGVNRLLANSSGQVAVTLAGSAATPSFTKDDDLNTGLFYPAADTLAITSGGTERARIDSSGIVGIGTSTADNSNSGGPAAKLVVKGNVAVGPSDTLINSTTTYFHIGGDEGGSQRKVALAHVPAGDWGRGSLLFCVDNTADGSNATTADEALRITGDKYLRMAASTGGIQFNGDTAAANALDDYEEGTWTPTWSFSGGGSVTTSVQGAYYIKVGKLVHVQARFFTLAISSPSGDATLGGLPFAVGGAAYYNGFTIGEAQSWATAFTELRIAALGETTNMRVIKNATNVAESKVQGSDFGSGSGNNLINMTGTYVSA